MTIFWIVVRVVSALWLLAVFFAYAQRAAELAENGREPFWVGVIAFVSCVVAYFNTTNWLL